MYARIGRTFSPISGGEVKKHTVTDVIDFIKTFEDRSRLLLLSPIEINEDRDIKTVLKILSQQGYARLQFHQQIFRIEDLPTNEKDYSSLRLVVDRVVVQHNEDFYNRLGDAVQTAYFEGKGVCYIENMADSSVSEFNNKFELDGIHFLEPNTHLFSFNNPYGACPTCEGYGNVIGIDEDLVIPNTGLSIYEDAILPFRSNSYSHYKDDLIAVAYKYDIPIHQPWFELTKKQKHLVWKGNKDFNGIHHFFEALEEKSYKIQNRVMLSRYRGKTLCKTCHGKRLRKEANYVQVHGKSISELVDIPLDELYVFFQGIQLNPMSKKIAKRLLTEINSRLRFTRCWAELPYFKQNV